MLQRVEWKSLRRWRDMAQGCAPCIHGVANSTQHLLLRLTCKELKVFLRREGGDTEHLSSTTHVSGTLSASLCLSKPKALPFLIPRVTPRSVHTVAVYNEVCTLSLFDAQPPGNTRMGRSLEALVLCFTTRCGGHYCNLR